jgi:hypothetical protein
VLDRAKITGFELKANTFAQIKDMIIKKGHKIERVPPILTTAWSLDQLLLLLRSLVPSRRTGRFALVKATIYNMKKQPSAGLPYTQFVLQSVLMGHSGYGHFYGSLADAAADIAEGTTITLVQPKVELEGAAGNETVVLTLDDTFDPPCAIAQ